MKELKFEELTLKQKIGMVMAASLIPVPEGGEERYGTREDNFAFVMEKIREKSLGAVWVVPRLLETQPDIIDKIKEAADYPILIITDAEAGLGDYTIGRHNAIGTTGSEELAYTFGKVTGVTAAKMGYNVVCNPVLDMAHSWVSCGGNSRCLGSDKYKVASLGAEIAKGLHDGGVLTVAKHYPSPGGSKMDGHMAPSNYEVKKDDLIEYNLFPYIELIKQGLIDGIMSGHSRLINIDPKYPATLSKEIKGIIRDLGFEGFFITDALDMMSIRAEFGDTDVTGLCIESGIEFILPWLSSRKAYSDLYACYEKGIISEERLDEAVKTVLAAQHKVMNIDPKYKEITEDDAEKFNRINRDGIYLEKDDDVEDAISKDGKHLFVVLAKNESEISDDGKVTVDTFTNHWWKPDRIVEKLEKTFPNSKVRVVYQFPTAAQNMHVLADAVEHDDVIMVTFTEAPACTGSDHITHRMVALITALGINGKLSTLCHFGNPYPIEELPHISRVIMGGIATDSVDAGIDVLAGDYPAKGVLTYDIKLQ